MNETKSASSPMCPWCGDEVTDSPETDIPLDGEHEIDCGGCGKPVLVTARAVITYETRKARDEAVV